MPTLVRAKPIARRKGTRKPSAARVKKAVPSTHSSRPKAPHFVLSAEEIERINGAQESMSAAE